ncbi:NFACT family protein [Clostridium estertheticum]|uniref:Rqc2 family fibronectin-binding protein n=1 Tax=Clostridium estertheticum TaxID=238834 RepID=UPI001CF34FF5|nr:NFACT RNA binding domain-containing protein [Clostridium estertheticum]MCB2308058.1 NFACT family protein [Clostridium estertheticum]MCB2346182.1 NFACT family protein [Clostridium estertheticum]MCB2351400.1 NFACT family protein [Clostridium estertheticum]WAG44568.1 NFACT family protein [Clostridium estertheticum]
MALDGIFLSSLIEEIKDVIIDCRVDKVNQPEKDQIILSFKKNRKIHKLLISSGANYPRIHFTDFNLENPKQAPIFCMVLRKYLNTATVLDVRQLNSDRLLVIDFKSSDELGFDSMYSLIIEIMGRHSNISLVRTRDNIIMDSIKHVGADVNSFRVLYTGVEYIYPPASTKLDAFNFEYDEFYKYITTKDIQFTEKFFTGTFTGVSSNLSSELVYRYLNKNADFNLENAKNIYDFTTAIFKNMHENKFLAAYSKKGVLKDFHSVELTSLKDCEIEQYDSPSKLIETFYFRKDKHDRLNAKSSNLQKIINTNISRCDKKMRILNATLKDCSTKGTYKLHGELLTANIYSLKKGDKFANLVNYYSDNGEYIKIKLDENKTPSQNVQYYYKKYNKFKIGEEMALIQMDLTENELKYLHSVLTNILNVDNYSGIEDIKNELIETEYIKIKKHGKTKKVKPTKPRHFISSDGIDIYVGRNNIQNDLLTLKFANKNDMWLHTKDIPGSHVIIKNIGDIPANTLLEAVNLSAFYSKSQNSSSVPVDYTQVRNVKKPSGAKPGMVIYTTNKTIYVTPVESTLKRIE